MPSYETTGSKPDFNYSIEYSEQRDGWRIDGTVVRHNGKDVLAKRALDGHYRNESLALAYGINWCEAIVKHLSTGQSNELQLRMTLSSNF